MSTSRILPRLSIILVCALLAASVGVAYQALRITGAPQEFRSMASIAATGALLPPNNLDHQKRESYYKAILETLESADLSHHALKRVTALHPELKISEMKIRATQAKGIESVNILAIGQNPKLTRIYLDALLDEFMILRHNLSEQENRPADVAVQERASPASEYVQEWKLPIAIGAIGGGLLGALVGLLLSLIILRSPKPQIPAVG